MPNRREFIGSAAAASLLANVTLSQTRRRPNILFILADDLGYGDLSCYGRPDYETPNLDRLASQGVRFVNAYSASPLCTPTRCAFITGRYPARVPVGLEEPLHERRAMGERALTIGLPREHPTVASLLKGNGYHTALIGKWHLGYLPNFSPIKSGFEEFYGIMSGAADFFTHQDMQGDLDFYEGEVPLEAVGYTTDLLTRRAVEYISRRRDRTNQPFYLSLHYTAPHWPWEGPNDRPPDPELRGPVAFRAGGSLKTYAAMMKRMDDGIGEVLNALSRAGLGQHTLVIFTSDNGGERFSYNWPFSGEKGSLWEGGIRVPAILRWPGRLPKNKLSELQVITMDWTATLLAAANTNAASGYPLDGLDVVKLLSSPHRYLSPSVSSWGRNAHPRSFNSESPARGASPESRLATRKFFWRHSNQSAVVDGLWKYLHDGTNEYLFNLNADQRERANFSSKHTAVFERLKRDFAEWESTVLPRPAVRVRPL